MMLIYWGLCPGAYAAGIGVTVLEKPKALLFDLDGTLVDTEPLHLRTWMEAFGSFGIPFPAGEESNLQGRRGEQVIEWLRSRLGASVMDAIDPGALVAEKRERFERIIPTEVQPLPGAEAFLRRNKGDLPLGLVTSSRLETVGQMMLHLNWRNIFDALVGAQHVANPKPHPEPYHRAVQRFKLQPGECVVFEDSPVGIESARAAGCLVCGISTTLSSRELFALGADWAVADFTNEPVLELVLAGERGGGLSRLKRRIFG